LIPFNELQLPFLDDGAVDRTFIRNGEKRCLFCLLKRDIPSFGWPWKNGLRPMEGLPGPLVDDPGDFQLGMKEK
jgi:hypothetical protein